MTAPAGLSGSVPEPRQPEKTDLEPAATEPAATAPVAGRSAAGQSAAAQPAAGRSAADQPVAAAQAVTAEADTAEAAAVELTAAVPKAAEPPDAELADAKPDTGPTGQAYQESAAAVTHPDLGSEPEDAQPAERADQARRVRPVAVAATVVGIIALIGAAVAVLAVATHGFRPKTVVTYRVPAVFSLRPGDCINSPPNGLSATVLSCATPHDAEVFATFSLAGSSWPGDAAAQQEASGGCASRIAGYLNPAFAEAGFAQEYIYPDQSAWQAGVRTVVCEVRASSGQLTGSVRKGG